MNERGYIGTYTKGKSEGIYSFILDTERKVLTDLRCAAKLDNPTYVAIDKKNAKLYSVVKDGARGGVAAYVIDEAGALQLLGESVREGSSPCYVSVNQEGGRILDGNYHEGTASSYVPDSALGLRHQAGVQHEGSSAHRERQEGPHVHFAEFTPDGRFAVTVDLGTDTLITYRVMEREWQENSTLVFKPGTGPRHLIFHPKAPYAYVMTELSNEVIALHFDLQSGTFTAIQTVNALPADFNGHSQGAAIKISADGRFVYVSNRGHNSIATFQVDEGSGRLALIEHTDTLGDWPRDIEIDPSGCFLIAANQNSGDVVLFERDPVNGTLTDLNAKLYVPDAVCVKFFGGR